MALKSRSLEAFYDQIGDAFGLGVCCGRNLDALDDILSGGDLIPEGGFILRWTYSDASRANLGYAETVRQLEKRLEECHPTNRELVRAKLSEAKHGKEATVFDWLVEIIRRHDADGVCLVLE